MIRKLRNQQLSLTEGTADHPKAKELAGISKVLDNHHSICELALQDFDRGDNNVVANSMTVEQIIRAAILKQTEDTAIVNWPFIWMAPGFTGNSARSGL